MRASRCDLLIVGAGPAGCAAAAAARAEAPRLSVVAVDAARFPRDKLCAGAITGGGLRELDLAGLRLRVPHALSTHAVLRVDGRVQRVELARPAAVVRRRVFDADLVAQVRGLGASVIEEAPLLGIDGGVARTGAGDIEFGAMVCADGAGGASRRALGLPGGRRAQLLEALAPGSGQRDLVFDLDAGVGAYAWRFPCLDEGRASESCGVYAPGGAMSLEEGLRRWSAREGLEPGPAGRWALRLAEPGGPVGRGRALLVGDALGADPLAGEGIRYALWSGRIAGRLAARALSRGLVPSPQAYRRRLAASRSGMLLALSMRLAPRLHGGDPRWRRAAADRRVALAVAALVSGEAPLRPLLELAARFLAVGGRRPASTEYPLV